MTDGAQVVDLNRLYAALDQRRGELGADWKTIAAQAGVSAPVFTRLGRGYGLSLDGYARLCTWLGASLDEFRVNSAQAA